jgi:hypothetical protein
MACLAALGEIWFSVIGFIEMWKTIFFVLNNTRQPGEPEIKPLMLALSDMCKEYDYSPHFNKALPLDLTEAQIQIVGNVSVH